jgi:hypothetical protein
MSCCLHCAAGTREERSDKASRIFPYTEAPRNAQGDIHWVLLGVLGMESRKYVTSGSH